MSSLRKCKVCISNDHKESTTCQLHNLATCTICRVFVFYCDQEPLEVCTLCSKYGHSNEKHVCSFCLKRGHRRDDHKCSYCLEFDHDTARHICEVCNQVGHGAYLWSEKNQCDETVVYKCRRQRDSDHHLYCINMGGVKTCTVCKIKGHNASEKHTCQLCNKGGHLVERWCSGCNKNCSYKPCKCDPKKIFEYCPVDGMCQIHGCRAEHPAIMHRCSTCGAYKYHKHHDTYHADNWSKEQQVITEETTLPEVLISLVEDYIY